MSGDEYWGMSCDDCVEEIWHIPNEAIGAHYIAFDGDKNAARQKMIDAFTVVIDKLLYRATPYGSRWLAEDDGA